jgi:hypothetical protein
MTPQNVPRELEITNGPGEMDMMISLFRRIPVLFSFEDTGRKLNSHEFVIYQITNREMAGEIYFLTLLPFGETGRIFVEGCYNFRTKKGKLNTSRVNFPK